MQEWRLTLNVPVSSRLPRVEPEDMDVVTTADLATLRRDVFQKQDDILVPAVKNGTQRHRTDDRCDPSLSARRLWIQIRQSFRNRLHADRGTQDRMARKDVRLETPENSARAQSTAMDKMQEQLKAALDEFGILQNTEP